MMKKIIPLFTTLLLLGWSMNAWSFACKTATGATIPIGGGSANVYVNLTPGHRGGVDFPQPPRRYSVIRRGVYRLGDLGD